MFRDIDAQCYIMVDGDDTYPAEYAREMCDKVLNDGTDMVVGDRLSSTYFTENKRPFHNFGNTIVRAFINRLFHSNIKDIMTGYRAMSYRFVKTFPVLSRNFEIETEMTIHAIDKKMQVDNVIVDYRDRQEGSESKLNTYSDGAKVLKTIFRMYKDYKPLQFFSTIAGALFVLGIIFFIPILKKYIKMGVVTKIPSLIVVCFVILTAIICWFFPADVHNGLLHQLLWQSYLFRLSNYYRTHKSLLPANPFSYHELLWQLIYFHCSRESELLFYLTSKVPPKYMFYLLLLHKNSPFGGLLLF